MVPGREEYGRVDAGASLEAVTAGWTAETRAFETLRRPNLLYP